jgi:hypothetical protein
VTPQPDHNTPDESPQGDQPQGGQYDARAPAREQPAKRAGVSPPRAKSLYLAAATESEHKPFAEIVDLFDAMSS